MLVKNKMKKMMTKKREKSMKAFAEAGLGRMIILHINKFFHKRTHEIDYT